jgi:hypothetical protein
MTFVNHVMYKTVIILSTILNFQKKKIYLCYDNLPKAPTWLFMTLIRESCFMRCEIVELLKIQFNISSLCGLFNSYCFLLLLIEKG